MFSFHHILPHLPHLAAVAQAGGFTQAAEQLGVTQSAVSYQIKQLEQKLGARLIVRQSGSRISLTGAGEALVAEYGLMAHRLELTISDLTSGTPSGRLRLTVPVDFGSKIIPPALALLTEQAPALSVDLIVTDTVADLKRDAVDMAVRSAPMDDDLIHRPVAHAARVMVASPDYIARNGMPSEVPDLIHHRILTRASDQSQSWQQLLAPAGLKLTDMRSRQPLGNSFALMEGARAGLGLAILPRFLAADDLAARRLIAVALPSLEVMKTRFYLSFLPLPQLKGRADLIEGAIRQVMAATPFGSCFEL